MSTKHYRLLARGLLAGLLLPLAHLAQAQLPTLPGPPRIPVPTFPGLLGPVTIPNPGLFILPPTIAVIDQSRLPLGLFQPVPQELPIDIPGTPIEGLIELPELPPLPGLEVSNGASSGATGKAAGPELPGIGTLPDAAELRALIDDNLKAPVAAAGQQLLALVPAETPLPLQLDALAAALAGLPDETLPLQLDTRRLQAAIASLDQLSLTQAQARQALDAILLLDVTDAYAGLDQIEPQRAIDALLQRLSPALLQENLAGLQAYLAGDPLAGAPAGRAVAVLLAFNPVPLDDGLAVNPLDALGVISSLVAVIEALPSLQIDGINPDPEQINTELAAISRVLTAMLLDIDNLSGADLQTLVGQLNAALENGVPSLAVPGVYIDTAALPGS